MELMVLISDQLVRRVSYVKFYVERLLERLPGYKCPGNRTSDRVCLK